MINLAPMARERKESLSAFVKRIRNERDLSLNEVVRKAGLNERGKAAISNAYVSKIENGYSIKPSHDKLRALARGLDIPYERLRAHVEDVDDSTDIEFADAALRILQEKLRTAHPDDKPLLRGLVDMAIEWADRRERARG